MPVGKLTLELEIPHAHSLKDRRQVVRSLKDTLRHSFNVSVAETDGALVWNLATLEIAAVSSSQSYLSGQLRAVERAAARNATRLGAILTDSFAELLQEGAGDDLDLTDDLAGSLADDPGSDPGDAPDAEPGGHQNRSAGTPEKF